MTDEAACKRKENYENSLSKMKQNQNEWMTNNLSKMKQN